MAVAIPFIGELQIMASNFAPGGWALADGATLPISQAAQLFALIGTSYGGDGITRFGVPDMMARTAAGQGAGPGLTPRAIGDVFGLETVALTADTNAGHRHPMVLYDHRGTAAETGTPQPGYKLTSTNLAVTFVAGGTPSVSLDPSSINAVGASAAHENHQPFLAMTYIISLKGVFPVFD